MAFSAHVYVYIYIYVHTLIICLGYIDKKMGNECFKEGGDYDSACQVSPVSSELLLGGGVSRVQVPRALNCELCPRTLPIGPKQVQPHCLGFRRVGFCNWRMEPGSAKHGERTCPVTVFPK